LPRIFRHSSLDSILVGLSLAHGTALVAWASVPLVAIGMWWNANTVAHNFIHLPFFRPRTLNRVYSWYLSLIMGIPQSLWRRRHLAHHAGRPLPSFRRLTADERIEATLVAGLWITLVLISPSGFVFVYLPGWFLGLGLCQLQGHYEHARGTTSHYGRIYNTLFFNDGYHTEHHGRPSEHWSRLRSWRDRGATTSRWPPVLRWLDAVGLDGLDGLERLVLASSRLQRFVVERHERAFRRLFAEIGDVRSVTIVGGGLFPRTAIVLSRLTPGATLTIVDANAAHLEMARSFLGDSIALKRERFDAGRPVTTDVVVVPLAYIGDRRAFYDQPPARVVLVHDWIWSRRSRGVVVSWLLLKRLNLVLRRDDRVAALPAAS
jgi:hypothetical protein